MTVIDVCSSRKRNSNQPVLGLNSARFTHAITACGLVFKEIMLVGSNQGNYFENATAFSKCTLKIPVAIQL